MSYHSFDQGIPASEIQKQKRQQLVQQAPQIDMLSRFKESERRLSILRTIGTHIDHEPTEEEMRQWFQAVQRK